MSKSHHEHSSLFENNLNEIFIRIYREFSQEVDILSIEAISIQEGTLIKQKIKDNIVENWVLKG